MAHGSDLCWIAHDGAAGNRRQVVALAEALELPVREWILVAHRPWRWFAPRKMPGSARVFGPEYAHALATVPPRLIIGCGRQAALATRLAREAGAEAVQILAPRISPRHWNWVIAPEHDDLVGDNVIPLLGSLHPVTPEWLASARARFPALGQLPSPRTAVLLGGPTRAVRFGHQAWETLASKLDRWQTRDGGSLMICGSRRTPKALARFVREHFASQSVLWLDPSDGNNPYAGVLAWADRIIVSPDSVNMISEAGATGVPVFIAEPECASGRIRTFIANLQARGRVRPLQSESVDFPITPLQETARIAALLRRRLRTLR